MSIPKIYNGRYQIRTKSGRLIKYSNHIEELESFRNEDRIIWYWFEGKYFAK